MSPQAANLERRREGVKSEPHDCAPCEPPHYSAHSVCARSPPPVVHERKVARGMHARPGWYDPGWRRSRAAEGREMGPLLEGPGMEQEQRPGFHGLAERPAAGPPIHPAAERTEQCESSLKTQEHRPGRPSGSPRSLPSIVTSSPRRAHCCPSPSVGASCMQLAGPRRPALLGMALVRAFVSI
jgi:hypothetical protein